jgi:16S rRNA processing protein RimM
MSENLKVGRIVNTHGLKGQLKVEVLTDFEQRLAKGRRLRLKDDWVTVEASQWQDKRMLVKLSGIDSIDAAKALQWEYLYAAPGEEIELEEDEFFVEDLVGMKVVTTDGDELGEIEAVEAYPAQDILVISSDNTPNSKLQTPNSPLMLPFVEQFVKKVDFDTETITVELLEGMLGDAEEA